MSGPDGPRLLAQMHAHFDEQLGLFVAVLPGTPLRATARTLDDLGPACREAVLEFVAEHGEAALQARLLN